MKLIKNKFEGWYFKHQKGEKFLVLIVGTAKNGAFIQMITNSGSRQFKIADLSVSNGIIRADNCIFSKQGCKLCLEGICGELKYKRLTPLKYDIMGPFRFFPMQCRHGVISMAHSICGNVCIDGNIFNFNNGKGYIEKDSGASFPKSYLWLQCNDFNINSSIILSIADIPFCGKNFTGCICALNHKGYEYRFATYCGVKIKKFSPEYIMLSQGKMALEIEISTLTNAHPLRSPVNGIMCGNIFENTNAAVHIHLRNNGKLILNLYSHHAMYEYVP